jgi:hypothetical protein
MTGLEDRLFIANLELYAQHAAWHFREFTKFVPDFTVMCSAVSTKCEVHWKTGD